MGIKGLFRMLFCSALLSAGSAEAVEVHGRSSTQFLSFNNIFNDRTQSEIAQYLQVGITHIDKAGKFSVYGYGRGSEDVTNGEGLNGRLYYFYGDYRDLYDRIDLRIGRQFVNIAAGNALIDGGKVDLKNVGPVAFTVLGGRNVIFGLNGEATRSGDAVFGVAASLAGFKKTDLELGYFAKWGADSDSSGPVRETLGISFKQYLLNSLKAYADARFDLYSEVFSEVQAGVKYFPMANLVFTGEWYQSYPTFDADSIFAVFAVNRYQEGVFRVDYTINDKIGVNAGYNRQDFGDDGMADVYSLGCRLKPIEPLVVNLSYDKRHGFNGSLDGGIIDVAYRATRELDLAAGFQYDVYTREDIATTGQETARRYWAGAKYKLSRNMSASGRIEDDVNRKFENDWRGRLVFNYDF